jgi:glyoxylase-like metal-dependent hydrolase (beta-lactamase superfamily II)
MALARLSLRFLRFRGVSAVRPIADGESLHGIGLPGRVYYTPGHSGGCVSLVLDDGTALTGDLVQGPRRAGSPPEVPAMGEDPDLIRDSWRHLLGKGVRQILPAHGAAHKAEDLRQALELSAM